MPRIANGVAESTTTTGTGSFALGGAMPQHRTFQEGLGSGSIAVYYTAQAMNSNEWEDGIGTFISGSNVVQRDLVLDSLTGSKVNFSAGTKVIYLAQLAEVPILVRIRRSGDIGLEFVPASGQSANIMRVQREDGGDAWTVGPTGSMRSGRIDIVASDPTMQLSDTDQALPAGRWRLRVEGSTLQIQRATSGNFTASETEFEIGASGVSAFDMTGGLGFGSAVVSDPQDLSRHLDLFGGGYGWSISAARMNHVVASAGRHAFYAGEIEAFQVYADGIVVKGNLPPTIAMDRNGTISRIIEETGGIFNFQVGSEDVAARIIAAGTGAGTATVVITREKGDFRYAQAASARWLKRDIGPPPLRDLTSLQPRGFTWDLDEDDPRNGRRSIGFIADEVNAVIPEAAMLNEDGEPYGVDPLALLAAFTLYFRERLDRIETRMGA
jgi:hypothetical protein